MCIRDRFTVELEPTWQVATVLASFAAGWISWRFIERPFRVPVRVGGMGQGRIFALSGVGMAVLGGLAAVSVVTQGLPQRFSAEQNRLVQSISRFQPAEECFGQRARNRPCLFGAKNAPVRWVLWGDSHAKSILPALDILARRADIGLMFISAPSCPPMPGLMEFDPGQFFARCIAQRQNDLARIEAQDSVDTVFLAARWTKYVEGTTLAIEAGAETVFYTAAAGKPGQADISQNPAVVLASLTALRDRFLSRGQKLVLLGTVPEIPWNVADRLMASVLFNVPMPAAVGLSDVMTRQAQSDAVLTEVAQAPNTFYIPLTPQICRPSCPTHEMDTALYRDNHHLTAEGARRLVLPILERALADSLVATEKP